MKKRIIYLSVCKQTIAQNRKLLHSKRVGPIRMSEGKHRKPRRIWGFGTDNVAYVGVHYMPDKPMPWGARAWVQITLKK
jgi:hypothetical protein